MKGSDVAYLKRMLRKWGVTTTPGNVYDDETAGQVRFFRSFVGLGEHEWVDELVWQTITSGKLPRLWETYTDTWHKVLSGVASGMVGIPYLHGSDKVWHGLDSYGFLVAMWDMTRRLPVDPPYECPPDLSSLVEAVPRCDYIQGLNMSAFVGGLALYSSKTGVFNHCMYILNEALGIGAVGGNRYTRSVDLAIKRDARVKVKPLNYRPGLTALVSRVEFRTLFKGSKIKADQPVSEDPDGHQGNRTRVQG